MIPRKEDIDAYIESVEQFVFTSISAATPDLHNVRDAFNRLWDDVSRYGPSKLPSIHDMKIPVLKDFQIPPPPPPVPPKSQFESSMDWIAMHPFTTSGIIVLGVVGVGLLVGYGASRRRQHRVIKLKAVARERRQVVVVLGGDHPLGLPLILSLEKQGYIVITSVSSPDAVDVIEGSCHGYVRALVLDPNDSEFDSIPIFLRSLSSSLSRRFPLHAAGDPHAAPSAHPYIHSVISLLTIPSPTSHSPLAPLEHLSMRNTYLPYLNATHIVPLQVLQALLPLLRTTPARARDASSNGNGKKTIIVCLPAADACVGLPFASMQAMSAAATLRGAEVLRREINAVAHTDKSESMKNIKVVIVDVGVVDVGTSKTAAPATAAAVESESEVPAYKAMSAWTASEKLTYGPAFTSILPGLKPARPPTSRWVAFRSIFDGRRSFGIGRRPADVSVFVDMIVALVSTGGTRTSLSTLGFGLGLGRVKTWFRGERFVVGAGARTYRCASHLPALLLDTILNIPHFLMSVRNALLPIQPSLPQSQTPPTSVSSTSQPVVPSLTDTTDDHQGEPDRSEADVEAEVESGLEEEPPNNSWVTLKNKEGDETSQS